MVQMWSIKEHAQFHGFPFLVWENQIQLIKEIKQGPQREAFLFTKLGKAFCSEKKYIQKTLFNVSPRQS